MHMLSSVRQHDTPEGEKTIRELLRPSWLSGLVCVVVALLLVGLVVGLQRYHTSSLEREVLVWHAPSSPDAAYEAAFNAEYSSTTWQSIGGDVSTGLFWSFFALVVYAIAFGVYDVIHTAKRFTKELEYVHANPAQQIRAAKIRVVIRVATLAGWFAYIVLFYRNILPDVLMASHVAGSQLTSFVGVGYASVAFIILLIALHIHVVLLRTLLLRPRLFGGEID